MKERDKGTNGDRGGEGEPKKKGTKRNQKGTIKNQIGTKKEPKRTKKEPKRNRTGTE